MSHQKSFIIGLTLILVSSAQAQFGPVTTITRSDMSVPNQVFAVDLDNDGDKDLLVSSWAEPEPSRVYIAAFLGAGDGTFSAMAIVDSTTYGLGQIDVRDLDLDGDSDIVACTRAASDTTLGTTFWYPGTGTGAFGPPQAIGERTGHCGDLAVGDLDGDGDLDVADGGAGIYWHENSGDGSFVGEHEILDATNDGILNLQPIDWNEDGDMDIAYVRSGFNLRLASNNGSGTLWGTSSLSLQVYVRELAFIDLNGDAYRDLIGYCTDMQANRTLRTYAGLGNENFDEIDVFASESLFHDLTDMDGDGLVDILGTYGSVLGWWRNLGDGHFGPHTFLLAIGGYEQDGLRIDLSGDGIPDIVECYGRDDQLAVHIDQGNGTYGPPQDLLLSASSAFACALADVDADGDLDAVSSLTGPCRIAWWSNDGNGGLVPQTPIAFPGETVLTIELVDMEPDGDLDVLATTYAGVLFFENEGTYPFTAVTTIASSSSPPVATCMDADVDGDQDILVGDYDTGGYTMYMNNGNQFSPGTTLLTGQFISPQRALCTDLDDDGDQDAVVHDGSSSIHICGSNGNGTFQAPQQLMIPYLGDKAVLADDLDGDGDRDLLISGRSGDGAVVVENISNGEWGDQHMISNLEGGKDRAVLMDVDLDGDPDLITGSSYGYMNDPALYWQENHGNFTFSPPVLVPLPVHSIGCLSAGNLDGDAHPDLFFSSAYEDRIMTTVNFVDESILCSGTVYFDIDADSDQDVGEPGISYVPVAIDPYGSMVYSDLDGHYQFYGMVGTSTVSAAPVGQELVLSSDSSAYHLDLLPGDAPVTDLDFGYSGEFDNPQIQAAISMGPDGCDTAVFVWSSLQNQGIGAVDLELRLDLDPLFSYVDCTVTPDSVVGSSIYWSLAGLAPGASFTLLTTVLSPGTDEIGSLYTNSFHATAYDDLDSTATDLSQHMGTISCSYDPNSKQVQPLGFGSAGYVDISLGELDYIIHFQNTGNDTAHQVVLRDQLHPDLVREELSVVGGSHPFQLVQTNVGEAVFTFENIQLPDSGTDFLGSQGFVRFRLPIAPGLPSGTLITNTAAIYFDNNPAVITNTVNTTLWDCSLFEATITAAGPDTLVASEGITHEWYLNGSPIGQTSATIQPEVSGTYTVEITDAYGCVAVSPPYVHVVSGVQGSSAPLITLIPNPATNEIRILAPYTSLGSFVLLDALGRKVVSRVVNGTSDLIIQRADLPAGLYTVHLMDRAGRTLASLRFLFR